jgi:hypothetical protein
MCVHVHVPVLVRVQLSTHKKQSTRSKAAGVGNVKEIRKVSRVMWRKRVQQFGHRE